MIWGAYCGVSVSVVDDLSVLNGLVEKGLGGDCVESGLGHVSAPPNYII